MQSFQLEKKSGKKCYMAAARALAIVWGDTERYWTWTTHPDSRLVYPLLYRYWIMNQSIVLCSLFFFFFLLKFYSGIVWSPSWLCSFSRSFDFFHTSLYFPPPFIFFLFGSFSLFWFCTVVLTGWWQLK